MPESEPFFVTRAGEVWACWLDGKPAVNLGSEQNFWASAEKLYNELNPGSSAPPSVDAQDVDATDLPEVDQKPPQAPIDRAEDRHEVTIIGRVYGSEGSNEITIYDLSERGCRIENAVNAKPGSFVSVKLGKIGPLDAMIRWRKGKSAGLKFSEPLHPAVLEHIRKQISLR
ncbi:hypothetical protein GRI62_06410 [Erythrobacter arachoides]|uniref:PilZ domain-containing protein n=1 Tax=Aurantiacibacter arachoides TaxID=1850444 RepID=A0A844ZZU2_9SPHN|nr:PilZ domain-containing protein [Aurantiacibacter arachoides]MXO93238.1 hypothetical protein [Aurantiacibacter arachoides]GGD50887.1 hypothetical protein GCM10011411_08440 [Aurantiacibacter arachoides]